MARRALLNLFNLSLNPAGDTLIDNVSTTIHFQDRLALVGRNGSGKSTLMKVMAGLIAPDSGECNTPSGVSVGYMEQDPDMTGYATLGDYAASCFTHCDAWRAQVVADKLNLDLDIDIATASGGQKRQAALVKLMAQAPDLMLLDEPTNHLDINAIQWLEAELTTSKNAFIVISHDRAFLKALTRGTLWIDRGELRLHNKGFSAFEDWRDEIWSQEDDRLHKMDRKIKAEARWAVEGISARRTRNMGRVRALHDLRQERSEIVRRQGAAALSFEEGQKSGQKVIEARNISKSYGKQAICHDFSCIIKRSDRIAFVGPNGVGKTTMINMLIGNEPTDSGTVALGTGLDVAVFDQRRAALDPQMSLWDTLTLTPETRVSGRSDQVMVRGTPRHVIGYLKDFLFDEHQARGPVKALSGGEKARLLLAKLMAQPSNLLVLDEPTNDLDVETLDLLQQILDDYTGTVLLVSHDRDFLDRVATMTIAFEGNGKTTAYAGGWSDYLKQAGPQAMFAPDKATEKQRAKDTKKSSGPDQQDAKSQKLSFTQKHRFEELPAHIDRLTAEIKKLEHALTPSDLYAKNPEKFEKIMQALAARQAALKDAEEEWLLLAEQGDR